MNILHICSITNNKSSGISCVVPEHFKNQAQLANVAILNCNKTHIDLLEGEKNIFYLYNINKKKVKYLDAPFNKPDIVIFHGVYISNFLSLSKELRNNNIPYIIIPHGSLTKDAQKIKPVKKKIANIILFNNFIKKATAIQYLSESEKNMSSKFKNSSYTLGNGMYDKKDTKISFSKKGLNLIYIGRYDIFHKGIDVMVSACKSIETYMKSNNIKLSLYGTGGDGINKVRQLILNENLEKIIEVNGPVFEEDKIKNILNNDIFIQTSRLEGQPLGIMEALSLGMPIIVTPGTTFGAAVKQENLGFVGNNQKEIANLIKYANENKALLPNISKNAIKYSKQNFSWDIIAKNSITQYQKIIGEKS